MLLTGAHPGEPMWGCRDKQSYGISLDGSFLGEAELMPEMFPASLQRQQGGCSSSLWTSPHWETIPQLELNPLPFPAAGPGEQPLHSPARFLAARDKSFTKPSAAPRGLQELVKKRESHNNPGERKWALPAGRAPGIRQQGCGKQLVLLSLPLFLFWQCSLKVEEKVQRSGLWQAVNYYPGSLSEGTKAPGAGVAEENPSLGGLEGSSLAGKCKGSEQSALFAGGCAGSHASSQQR